MIQRECMVVRDTVVVKGALCSPWFQVERYSTLRTQHDGCPISGPHHNVFDVNIVMRKLSLIAYATDNAVVALTC